MHYDLKSYRLRLNCFLMFVYRKFKNSRAVSSILRTFVWSRITWLPLIHGFSFRLQRTSCIEKIKSTIHVLWFYYGRHDNHQILLPAGEIRVGCQCVNINKKLVLYNVAHAQMSKYLANESTAWHSDFSIALLHFASKTPLTLTLKGVRNIQF